MFSPSSRNLVIVPKQNITLPMISAGYIWRRWSGVLPCSFPFPWVRCLPSQASSPTDGGVCLDHCFPEILPLTVCSYFSGCADTSALSQHLARNCRFVSSQLPFACRPWWRHSVPRTGPLVSGNLVTRDHDTHHALPYLCIGAFLCCGSTIIFRLQTGVRILH